VYSHHKFDHVFEGSPAPTVSFAVCALPRSGSSVLCELLTNTGLAGAPTEFFDLEQMEEFKRIWNVDTLDGYLDALLSKKTSPNGVFGFKALYGQFAQAFSDRDVRAVFPNLHFIHVSRRDRLRQAVSFARAMQTEKWAFDHPVPPRTPVFDPDQIRDMLEWIDRDERGWERFFTEHSISPLRVVYEDYVGAMEETVARIAAFLGITFEEGFRVEPPTLRKQADELSEEWVKRYLALAAPE
jgi:LPS sulfotransferase NodH